jgi:hypothetical protein
LYRFVGGREDQRGSWGLLALFLIGGIAFWITSPDMWIGQIWVGVSVILAIVYVVMFLRAEQADVMKQNGIPGQAEILEMSQSGVYVNGQPRVNLKLSIQAPGIAPFEDTKTHTVPLVALGRLTAGMPLAVYLKPDKPRDYTIDWLGAPGAALYAMDPMSVQSQQGVVNVQGDPGAAAAVMKALSDHGINPTTGAIDLQQLPAARAAVLKALEDHGIDVAHQVAAQNPAIPIEDRGEPMERIRKLDQLRATNLITPEEYESYRKRILEDV